VPGLSVRNFCVLATCSDQRDGVQTDVLVGWSTASNAGLWGLITYPHLSKRNNRGESRQRTPKSIKHSFSEQFQVECQYKERRTCAGAFTSIGKDRSVSPFGSRPSNDGDYIPMNRRGLYLDFG